MGVFEAQKVVIKTNGTGFKEGTRQPVGGPKIIAENIPCRITGTNLGNVVLFILKKYYESIPGGLHKDMIVTVEGINRSFLITEEPMWAGGTSHHIEVNVDELK